MLTADAARYRLAVGGAFTTVGGHSRTRFALFTR
ncbi:hypothetical protein EDD30_0505 [Couchioplanes caeruleus]|uniref:Uncharacterized protein n=1 Tax=Couchioplanes caeruleus TaxID=56438 RepID=A0A3N1GC53_9ACTN|nr:hypothetical protein EDD30_0505 [Couchioplanes caeruleus]